MKHIGNVIPILEKYILYKKVGDYAMRDLKSLSGV